MSENKKEQIITAALRRFAYYGYHKTTMNEIADDLHITKANLYYYYSDKAALVSDCIDYIFDDMGQKEDAVIDAYTGDLLATIYQLLDVHGQYIEEYYILSMQDVSEWVKNAGIISIVERFDKRNQQNIQSLFQKAIDQGELELSDPKEASVAFNEIISGLGTLCKMEDMLIGIPDVSKVAKILESQKRATKFILEGKLIRKQA